MNIQRVLFSVDTKFILTLYNEGIKTRKLKLFCLMYTCVSIYIFLQCTCSERMFHKGHD